MAEEKSDTVSREAHDRMTAERDKLKEENADLRATVLDSGTHSKAYDFFADPEKGLTAFQAKAAADMALPHLINVEPEKVAEKLDAEQFKVLWQNTAAAPPPVVTEGEESPEIPSESGVTESAAPAFAAPSPVGSGTTPEVPKLDSRELANKIGRGEITLAQVQQMDKDGQIEWSPAAMAAVPEGEPPRR